MAEDQSGDSDLTQGIVLTDLPTAASVSATLATSRCCWCGAERGCLRSAPIVRTTMGRSVTGLSSMTTVRCPWHHAYFDPQKGEALRAPASIPIPTWSVEQHGSKNFVGAKRATPQAKPRGKRAGEAADRMVIVGAGAAGFAAAEMPRREQYGARSSC
jgi:hypothetical protein